jgi:hypothetical protein
VFTSPDIIGVIKGVGGWGQVEGKCWENFGLETSVEKLKSVDNIKMDFQDCFLRICK